MDKKVMIRGSVKVNRLNDRAIFTEATSQGSITYEPKTPLGLKLQEIRARIIASGLPLLGPDEIEKEVAARRGRQE